MEKAVYTPYDWFDYMFAQSFAIIIVVLGSNKIVVVPIGILLTLLGFVRAFRTAKLMENEFWFFSLLKGKRKFMWNEVISIEYTPSFGSKPKFTFFLKSGEKLFFFANEEIIDFIENISKEKNIH